MPRFFRPCTDTFRHTFRLFLCLSIIATAHAGAQIQEAKARIDKVTLQLKWKHQFQFAGYYAAIKQGFYAEAGLEVELREPVIGMKTSDVVLRGDAEYGISTSDLILLHSRGRPVVALACIFQHSPLVFLVDARSGVGTIHGMAKARLMIEPDADELIAYLAQEGISRTQLNLTPHEFSVEPMIERRVDAISAYETDEAFMLQQAGIDYLKFTPRAGGIDFYGDTLFASEKEAREHPDRTRRFVEASLKGWAYALTNPEEMIDYIFDHYGDRHSREHLQYEAEMTQKLILPKVVEIGYMNPGRWRHIADTYANLGMMPAGVSLDGFLFDRSIQPDLRALYTALLAAMGIIAVVSLVAIRFYRLHSEIRLKTLKLQAAFDEINVLRGIIPICSYCKKIRDDAGLWSQMEIYIMDHSDAEFTHGICEDCYTRLEQSGEFSPDEPTTQQTETNPEDCVKGA
jgi:ABC-type nitrate/sulfonate/bicarbonate transport system substrate-binding protein